MVIAKFEANNNILAFIKLSLIFTTKDLYSHIRFEIVEVSDTSICKQIFKQKTLDISENIETTSKFIQKSCALAQKSQSNQANKHQKNIFHAVGDKI